MLSAMRPPSPARTLFLIWLFVISYPLQSEVIYQTQASGLVASAQLLEGDKDKKAILFLHGFLQTRDFFTVRRLAEALHDMGYTVLLPNLTLGIDDRRQSLACEAIHTHSMDTDVAEIGFWVDWLHQWSGRPVTLTGHSVGSLQLLTYLSEAHAPPVEQAILISLIAFQQGPIAKEDAAERQRAMNDQAKGTGTVESYRLAFCNAYPTTARDYLSYLEWDVNKTLENLNDLHLQPTIILGGEDRRLGDDWLPNLQRAGIEVIKIPGANHFFDHEYEFELMDAVIDRLEQHSTKQAQ